MFLCCSQKMRQGTFLGWITHQSAYTQKFGEQVITSEQVEVSGPLAYSVTSSGHAVLHLPFARAPDFSYEGLVQKMAKF